MEGKALVNVSRNKNDIIQKSFSQTLGTEFPRFAGINIAPIKEALNTELTEVTIAGKRADYLYLLEDDSLWHLEFQTQSKSKDFLRFLDYDLKIYEQQGERNLLTSIIYSADVKKAPQSLKTMSFQFTPHIVLLKDYDGNTIFKELQEKIANKQRLTNKDILNLVLLPLMNHDINRKDLALESIALARTIEDETLRKQSMASIYGLAEKYLEDTYINNFREVLKMSKFFEEITEERYQQGRQEEKLVIARSLLLKGFNVDFVIDTINIDEETVKALKEELIH